MHTANTASRWVVLILLSTALAGGCSGTKDAKDNSSREPEVSLEKNVEVLLGAENFEKVPVDLKPGEMVKIKGDLSMIPGRARVIVHLAEVYTGNEPSVASTQLVKDFLSDREGAEKKYQLNEPPKFGDIVVEGKVLKINRRGYSLILEGM